ncbi:hypothetical protein TNCV_902641 [Trichonephila clavipes]|nr:hypothetical protein TNCV_902641 [Trichonephila clavipes]
MMNSILFAAKRCNVSHITGHHQAASALGRLVEEENRCEAPALFQGDHPQNWGGTQTKLGCHQTATAGSDVVQSGRPIFDDFFQHLWPYIGNNTANVVFQMVKRLWLMRIDQ